MTRAPAAVVQGSPDWPMSPGEVPMTTPDRGQPPDGVQLRLVGTFAVACGGTPVAGPDLGSRKARTLLKLLAVERPRTVTADRIAEVLWGAVIIVCSSFLFNNVGG